MIPGRNRPAEAAPQDAEDEVLDREQREERIAAGRLQDEGKQPERRNRERENGDIEARSRVEEVEGDRDDVSDERAEDVADQEHARLLARLGVAGELGRDEPIDESVEQRQRCGNAMLHTRPRLPQPAGQVSERETR
jgi:hypothetical protein